MACALPGASSRSCCSGLRLQALIRSRAAPVGLIPGPPWFAALLPGEAAQGHGVALQLEASHREAGRGHGALAVGSAPASVVRVGSSSTSPRVASVTSLAPPSRNLCFSNRAEAVVSASTSVVLPASRVRRLEVRPEAQLRNSVRRHGEVHLGRAPGALVTRKAAVQGVVDVEAVPSRYRLAKRSSRPGVKL